MGGRVLAVIPISPELRAKLKALKRGGEDYTSLISRLIKRARENLAPEGVSVQASKTVLISLPEGEAQGLLDILAFEAGKPGSVRFKTESEPLASRLHDKVRAVLEVSL